ncbi:MAG: hypothetical protein NVSMB65_18440 [Chloroflexota bacterium]
MEQGNMTQVRRAVEEVWNAGDLALADVLFAPTYVNHGGLIPDLVRGPEAIKMAVTLYRAAFPGLHITVESFTAEQQLVEVRWAARRTRPAPGGPAAARQEVLTGTMRSRHAGGQIEESWMHWDNSAALSHLGIARPEPQQRHTRHPCSG